MENLLTPPAIYIYYTHIWFWERRQKEAFLKFNLILLNIVAIVSTSNNTESRTRPQTGLDRLDPYCPIQLWSLYWIKEMTDSDELWWFSTILEIFRSHSRNCLVAVYSWIFCDHCCTGAYTAHRLDGSNISTYICLSRRPRVLSVPYHWQFMWDISPYLNYDNDPPICWNGLPAHHLTFATHGCVYREYTRSRGGFVDGNIMSYCRWFACSTHAKHPAGMIRSRNFKTDILHRQS